MGVAAYLVIGGPPPLERAEVQIDTAADRGALSFPDRVEVVADVHHTGGNAGHVLVGGDTEVVRFLLYTSGPSVGAWLDLDVAALAPFVGMTPVELDGVLSAAAEAADLEDEFRRASSGGWLSMLVDADTDLPEEHGLRGLWCAVTWSAGQPATGCELPDDGSVTLDGVTLTTSRAELAGESDLVFTPEGHHLKLAEVERLLEVVGDAASPPG